MARRVGSACAALAWSKAAEAGWEEGSGGDTRQSEQGASRFGSLVFLVKERGKDRKRKQESLGGFRIGKEFKLKPKTKENLKC